MDIEKIERLMSAMEEKGITKISLKEENGFHLVLERDYPPFAPSHPPHFPSFSLPSTPQVDGTPFQKESGLEQGAPIQGHEVSSPMVGTFYTAPAPGAEPFVKIGDAVTEDSVIGVIEAMKVMNEIKAGKKGIVTEIFIENAHPVEFGTRLLRLL